jgi:hypothetical protein
MHSLVNFFIANVRDQRKLPEQLHKQKVIVTLVVLLRGWHWTYGYASFCFLRQIRQSGKILAMWQSSGNVAKFWQRGKINLGTNA